MTVTTFSPPRKPLTILARPSARRSLFTLDRLFLGSNLSTAFMLKRDSITAIRVMEKTTPINLKSKLLLNSGLGKSVNKLLGILIIKSLLIGGA